MRKRFTDVEKWSDLWYRKLPVAYKGLWSYLCDNVDNAGVWKIDDEAASFHIGAKVDAAEGLRLFNEGRGATDRRVIPLGSERWILTGFIAFQYGTLSEDCNAHKGVFKDLARNGLRAGKDGQIELPEAAQEPLQEPGKAEGDKTPAPEDKPLQRPARRAQQAGKPAPALPEWLDPQTWADFKELRLKLRRPLTAKGETLVIHKLDTLRAQGNDPKAVLLQTIENSWQGVFALKDRNTGAGSAAPKAGKYAEVRRISTASDGKEGA